MSVLVPVDATSWLQQDPAQATPDVMPAVAGHFTIFCWLNNLAPEVVLPAYKAALVLFTTADLANPSYSDPYALVKIVQSAGVQGITLEVSTLTMPVVTTGVEKRAVAITYDHTTHVWTFYLRRTAAWEVVGTITSNFATSDITQMRGLNDGIASGSIGSLSMAYFRLWNGKKLTLDELEDEANSAVAITAGVTTDTPLVTTTDLTDVSGNDHPWYVTGAGLTTVLPGPLTAATSFVIVPHADSSVASTATPTFACAARATTTGSPLSTLAVNQIIPMLGDPTVAAVMKAAGGWWQAGDTYIVPGPAVTQLYSFSPDGTVVFGPQLSILIGNGAGGSHDLMELPPGPSVEAPIGSLAFVGDAYHWPQVVECLTATGALLGDVPVVLHPGVNWSDGAGQGGFVQLDTGEIMIAQGSSAAPAPKGAAYFFTSNVVPVASATLEPPTAGYPGASAGGSVFAVLNGTGARLFGPTGAVLGNVAIPGTPEGLGINHDGTIIYSSDGGNVLQQTTGGVTTAFVDRSAHAGDFLYTDQPGTVLVLQDGTVISQWQDGVTHLLFALANNPDGTQRWRWDYGTSAGQDIPVCGCRGANATYFWLNVSFHASVPLTRVMLVRASDHAVLSSFTKDSPQSVDFANTAMLEIRNGIMVPDATRLLSVDRGTGAIVSVSTLDGHVAQTYGLTQTPLDGAVNTDGTRLIYIDALDIKAWDLVNDVDLGVLFTTDVQTRCLVWLQDCSLAMTTATYLGDGPGRRYALAGLLLNSYAYSPTPFNGGQYCLYANTTENRLLLIGAWDNGQSSQQPAALIFELSSGAQLGPVVPLVGELTNHAGVTAIAQVPAAVMCNPFPPVPPAPVFIPIRREIEFALIPEGDLNRRKYISRFEVIVQAGIGLPGTGQGSDPKFVVSFSDGGKVWGPLLTMAVGKQGDYGLPVYKNRIGKAFDPRARLVTSDPVDWQIVKCTIDVEEDESMP